MRQTVSCKWKQIKVLFHSDSMGKNSFQFFFVAATFRLFQKKTGSKQTIQNETKFPERSMHADFTSTSKLLFASFLERVLVQNISRENDLIVMRMNVQVTHIFIPIVWHKNLFHHRGKSKLRIGVFIHELAQGAFDSFPHRTNLSPDEMCFNFYVVIISGHYFYP